ncbi:MAG: hypothetical protein WCW47_00515 [Candidatus Paceibacterota bacterium]|jgi:hypothetical protein
MAVGPSRLFSTLPSQLLEELGWERIIDEALRVARNDFAHDRTIALTFQRKRPGAEMERKLTSRYLAAGWSRMEWGNGSIVFEQ